ELGDANKFRGVVNCHGYLFTFDDDLIYPENYVEDMIQAIDRYGKQAVITLHGKFVRKQTIQSFYGRSFIKFRCLDNQERNARVHIPGTGVMAWHSDTIQFDLEDFPEKNMADIWAGIKCQKENVPIVCLKHKKGYIKSISNDKGCYSWNRERDKVLTEAINSIEWK
ncbi:MAG: hypothetical protein GWN01_07550, partial [Nitrosopumilaceae archaeon]|nr:glycosyltransferase family 2 protein [Nitrosopumilaceae archaeon]NIU87224.1 hypothetical protein [Nitrosopumilaceae archaeon]NIX61377.1 hypothetical protein [Nitrosopumilaceae archaeon]